MSKHRAVRPRYGRVAILGSSLAVTAVAVLGGLGVVPTDGAGRQPAAALEAADSAPSATPSVSLSVTPTPDPTQTAGPDLPAESAQPSRPAKPKQTKKPAPDLSLPPDSGTGKRVVFDQSDQRVWLVTGEAHVERTYPVSGSVYDNLDPGTYAVYSRSLDAVGIEDSGTMRYFVRFAQGDNAAIGFHDIPFKDGVPLQTRKQLGTPQSHGCIRQMRPDAVALWEFAPLGTQVVVTA